MISRDLPHMQLREHKFDTPLFSNASLASAVAADRFENPAKYLVLNSKGNIDTAIFGQTNAIAPVYLHLNRSYISLEGECLWDYFRARRQSDLVLTEEQLWVLLSQMVQALLVLHAHGYQHKHLKEYAVRRVSASQFKLIFHPDMISQLELTSRSFYWYNFYFSPEELANHTDLSKAEVFSLGALVLNMMNPLDFTRIIYSYTEYRINKVVVNEKLLNAGRCYSQELMGLVALCLIEDVSRRIDLERLAQELKSNERLIKKKNFVMHIKPLVRNSPKRVKRSGSHDNSEEEWKKEDQQQKSKAKPDPIQKEKDSFLKENNLAENQCNQQENTILQFERGTFGVNGSEQQNSRHKSQPQNFPSIEEKALPSHPTNGGISHSQEQSRSESYVTYVPKQLTLDICLMPLAQLIKMVGRQGIWIQGDVYYGEFERGRRTGLGLEIFPEGEYYFGHFMEDLFHGEGFYLWSNHEHFLGEFEHGKKKQGRLNGKVKYDGHFKDNKRHGYGQCIYKNGAIYEGNWVEGKREGTGTLKEITGDVFVGTFNNGKKSGKGVYRTSDCTIEAEWDNDHVAGQVQICYGNGNVYRGKVDTNFEKNGEGYFHFSNGTTFRGLFSEDEFVKGQIVYRNGEIYIGEVHEMQRDGFGEYHYNNGTVFKGQWKAGSKIEPV